VVVVLKLLSVTELTSVELSSVELSLSTTLLDSGQ
jgi:hypothetical protein